MTRVPAGIAAVIAVGALIAGGCGDDGESPPAAGIPASVEASYSALMAREDSHHRAALGATEIAPLHEETGRYAADMDSLMDAMMDSCSAMGMGGMMGDHDMDRMRDLAGWMGDLVHDHHARMGSLSTLAEMRGECTEHHDAMVDLLGEMHEALPGG
jgi:hypothetical protein